MLLKLWSVSRRISRSRNRLESQAIVIPMGKVALIISTALLLWVSSGCTLAARQNTARVIGATAIIFGGSDRCAAATGTLVTFGIQTRTSTNYTSDHLCWLREESHHVDPLKFWQTVTAQNMGPSLRAEWHENVPNTV
jgi:hypothetical protein